MASEIRFLLKHSSIYGIGNLLSKLVAFALLPLYTRYLTPLDYGVLELVEITTGMIGVVLGIGIAQAMGRFYYESDDAGHRARVVAVIYIIVGAAGLFGFLVFSGLAGWLARIVLGSSSYTTVFVVSFASLALGMVIDVGQVYWRVTQRSSLYIAISLLNMIVGIALNILFIVYLEQGILGILYAGLLTRCLIGIPMTVIIIRRIGLIWHAPLARDILRYSLPLIPSQLANSFTNYSDRYFILYFVSIQDAGIYAIANKLGTAVHMLVTSPFIMTFQPRRFEIAEKGDVRGVLGRIYEYFLLLIVTVGLVLSVMIDEIMMIMTTPEYYRAGALVPLIVLTMVILSMRYHFEFGILYSKQTKYYMYINVVVSVVHVLGNAVLVYIFGLWGALYASFLSISLHSILMYIIGNRFYAIDFNFRHTFTLLALAIGIYLLSRLPLSMTLGWALLYKTALLAVYVAALLALNLIKRQELRQMLDMATNWWQRRRSKPA